MDTESNAIARTDINLNDRLPNQQPLPLTSMTMRLAALSTALTTCISGLNVEIRTLHQKIDQLGNGGEHFGQSLDEITDRLDKITDHLDEVEYKADNPDEQWDPHALRDTVSELVDEYVRDNLADAVQDILNRATVDIQARIIT